MASRITYQNAGRPRTYPDRLADEAAALRRLGWSWTRIAVALDIKDGRTAQYLAGRKRTGDAA